MLSEDPWRQVTSKHLRSAFAPFPRSTWIHPYVPIDDFDHVCKNIWKRAKKVEEEYGRGHGSSERQQNKGSAPSDDRQSHRAEEQPNHMQRQKTEDLSASTQYEADQQQHLTEFTLSCLYLLDSRHPQVAKPAWLLSPVMEEEMKFNEERKERKRILDKIKQGRLEDSSKKIWVPELRSRRHQRSFASEQQTKNPFCFATEESALHLLDGEDPPFSSKLPRDTYEIEDEQNLRCSKVEENKIPYLSDDINSDTEQEAYSAEMDFPPLSTIRTGLPQCPMECSATEKVHGRWEIPLSFHPHKIPTFTLAKGLPTPLQVPVQGKGTRQANSKNNAPLAVPKQQESYDLLADFPALQPPERPLALGALYDGNHKTNDAKGIRGHIHLPNHCQETGASQQRRMKNVPHKVSSICAGARKSGRDLQTFSSAELKANKESSPRVAGTDGMGVNARSWAGAAKAGMKQAAAPKEKARPCIFQQIVTINGAKDMCSNAKDQQRNSFPSGSQSIGSWFVSLPSIPQPRPVYWTKLPPHSSAFWSSGTLRQLSSSIHKSPIFLPTGRR